MFAYGIYVGYVNINTIRYHSPFLTTFILSTGKSKDQAFYCAIKNDALTNEWFKKYFDRSNTKFQGNLVVCQGELTPYAHEKNGVLYKVVQLNVRCMEFLDFTSQGLNAIDGGKFYDRKTLDWERYFSNDKFTQ